MTRISVLFHEYFQGDNGRCVGASHQTGWTGRVANLLKPDQGGLQLLARRSRAPTNVVRLQEAFRQRPSTVATVFGSPGRARGRGRFARNERTARSLRHQWQCAQKCGTGTGIRCRPKAPAMRLHNGATDLQSHAHAVRFGGVERIEESVYCFRTKADTAIRTAALPSSSSRAPQIVKTRLSSSTLLMASMPFMTRLSSTC
jgi:hypothetical protein